MQDPLAWCTQYPLHAFLYPLLVQPATIHGQLFAISSSLALYIHSAEQNFQLQRILVLHNRHLSAVCWSPVDANLLACSTIDNVRHKSGEITINWSIFLGCIAYFH